MKQIVIRFVVTEEERIAIKKEADNLRITVSAFIRLLIKQFSDGITFEKKKVDVSEPGGRDQHRESNHKEES